MPRPARLSIQTSRLRRKGNPVNLARRRWLLASGAVALSSGFITACSKEQTNTLITMLDTLLPEDEFAGALALGYDARLQQQITANPAKYGYLPTLASNVDDLALKRLNTPFVNLSQDQREALLVHVLEQGAELTRQNLTRLRSLIFNWYYGSQEGQRSLGYLAPAAYPARNSAHDNE